MARRLNHKSRFSRSALIVLSVALVFLATAAALTYSFFGARLAQREAAEFMNAGAYELAIARLEPWRSRTTDEALMTTLATAYLRTQRSSDAVVLLQQALTRSSSIPILHVLLGHAYKNQKQCDRAVPEYEIALQQENIGTAYYGLADCLVANGQTERAVSLLQRAVRELPNEKPLSDLLLSLNVPRDEKEQLLKKIAKNPRDYELVRSYFGLLLSRRAFEELDRASLKAEKDFPEHIQELRQYRKSIPRH